MLSPPLSCAYFDQGSFSHNTKVKKNLDSKLNHDKGLGPIQDRNRKTLHHQWQVPGRCSTDLERKTWFWCFVSLNLFPAINHLTILAYEAIEWSLNTGEWRRTKFHLAIELKIVHDPRQEPAILTVPHLGLTLPIMSQTCLRVIICLGEYSIRLVPQVLRNTSNSSPPARHILKVTQRCGKASTSPLWTTRVYRRLHFMTAPMYPICH